MRVLFLVGTLGAGGLERYVTRIALRAKTGGEFDPVICCLAERSGRFLADLERAGVEVFSAPKGWARSLDQLKAFGQLIRGLDPSVVHSQCDFAMLQQLIAARLGGCSNVCFTERNCYPLHGFARMRRIVQFYFLRAFGARYTANSTAVAQHLARLVRSPAKNIRVLPNGVPVVEPDMKMRAQVRLELGWKEDDIGVGYLARMAAHKGHADFLRATHELRQDGYSLQVCLVGDGPERKRLERLVKDLDLGSAVTFTGIVTNVEAYIQAFDVAVLLSAHEGMPNAILEAMAAGKAIVATGVGAVPELLNDGSAGIVVRRPTIDDLKNAIGSLLRDRNERENLSKAAMIRARTVFSIETAYAKLLKHYGEVN